MRVAVTFPRLLPPRAPCLNRVSSGNSSCNDKADGKAGCSLTQLASHMLNKASESTLSHSPFSPSEAGAVLVSFHS